MHETYIRNILKHLYIIIYNSISIYPYIYTYISLYILIYPYIPLTLISICWALGIYRFYCHKINVFRPR